jgi:hypothetical protein
VICRVAPIVRRRKIGRPPKPPVCRKNGWLALPFHRVMMMVVVMVMVMMATAGGNYDSTLPVIAVVVMVVVSVLSDPHFSGTRFIYSFQRGRCIRYRI